MKPIRISGRLPKNFGKPWTKDEDAEVVRKFDAGLPVPEIASAHWRTIQSVRLRLEKLGKIEPGSDENCGGTENVR